MMKFLESHFPTVLFLLLVLLVCLVLLCCFQSTMDRVDWDEETYIVKKGDSLWAISGRYCPANVDRREWIDEIKALNDLPDSKIYPGQMLTVLAPVEEG